jgi:hypothetical protein
MVHTMSEVGHLCFRHDKVISRSAEQIQSFDLQILKLTKELKD